MTYCKYCDREVRPIEEKDTTGFTMKLVKFLLFIVMCGITGGVWLLIYIFAKIVSKPFRMVCPICNCRLR